MTARAAVTASAALACLLVAFPAAVGGGFDASWWGWLAFVPLVVAAVVSATGRTQLSRGDVQLVGGLALFIGWAALSTLWSQSVPRTIADVERDAVYVAAALALVVVRRSPGAVAVGGLTATAGIAIDALGSRLWNGGTGRLDGPLIYWNALGILCAVGLLLALGAAVADRRGATRAAAGAASVVLGATLYLTYSRGSIAALAAGIALMFVLETQRPRLLSVVLAIAPPCAAAAVLAAHAPHAAAAVAIALLALLAGALTAACGRIEARLRRTALRGSTAVGIVCVFLVVALAGIVHAGRGEAVAAPRTAQASGTRLLTLSDHGRIEYWRVAWHEFLSAPLYGTGAGTYELSWHRHRNTFYDVRDAHSLYLETLSETGPLGLALLLVAVAAPFVRTRTTRRHALGPALLAAYGAVLLHAAVDWDWEMPAVMTAALVCGVAALGICDGPHVRVARRGSAAVAAALVVLAVGALGVQLANASQSHAYTAFDDRRLADAERDARRARRFAPWASEPLRILGEVQLGQEHVRLARTRFRQALRKDPNDWRLWSDLAAASTGPQQRRALVHALRLNPLEPALLAFADRLRTSSHRHTMGQ